MNSEPAFIKLQEIQIARPCRADWTAMSGNEQVRACQTCNKNVYNLSTMSRRDAEALIREKEGRLCVRLYRRADGTILTGDCPVGVRFAQRPLKWLAAGFAALLGSGFAIARQDVPAQATVLADGQGPRLTAVLTNLPPVRSVLTWLHPVPTPQPLMGEIALPVTPTKPSRILRNPTLYTHHNDSNS